MAKVMLTPEEGQQVGVELVRVRVLEAVRCARIVDFLGALDQPGRFLRRVMEEGRAEMVRASRTPCGGSTCSIAARR
jgi:hypothetical protein